MTEKFRIAVSDLLQACRNILAATDGKILPNDFDHDPFLLENISMNLMVIVEIFISAGERRKLYPQVDWDYVMSLVDVFKKGMDEVDKELIAQIVKNRIPSLANSLEKLLEPTETSNNSTVLGNEN